VTDLADHIAATPLIDQHMHGCWLAAGDRQRFENGLNEPHHLSAALWRNGIHRVLSVRPTPSGWSTLSAATTRHASIGWAVEERSGNDIDDSHAGVCGCF
jgi:hypothetical protein